MHSPYTVLVSSLAPLKPMGLKPDPAVSKGCPFGTREAPQAHEARGRQWVSVPGKSASEDARLGIWATIRWRARVNFSSTRGAQVVFSPRSQV